MYSSIFLSPFTLASYDVKVGDEIAVSFGARTVKVRVLSLKETVKKEEAAQLYEIISQE